MTTEFKKDAFFKIDPEFHLVGDMGHLLHFPGVQMWWRAVKGITPAMNTGIKPEVFVART